MTQRLTADGERVVPFSVSKMNTYKVKLSKKLTISILVAVLMLVLTSASILAYDYYSAKKFEREGDSLTEAQKYDEALSKYALANSRLFYKPDVKQKIERTLELKASLEAEKLASSTEALKIEAKDQDNVLGSKLNTNTQSQPTPNQNKQKAIENLKKQLEDLSKKYKEMVDLAKQCTETGAGITFCNNLHLPVIIGLQSQINDIKLKIAELEAQN